MWVEEKTHFIPLHFKLFNGVNVFKIELFLVYQILFDKVNSWDLYDSQFEKVTLIQWNK